MLKGRKLPFVLIFRVCVLEEAVPDRTVSLLLGKKKPPDLRSPAGSL